MRAALVCLLAAATSPAAPLATAADTSVTVLTGRTNGVYYALGVALEDVMRKAMPSLKASVRTTKSPVEILSLLQAGDGQLGFALGDSLSAAWKGNAAAGFKTPLTKLRGIAALYPNYVQIVARADSGVETLADLKGKKVSVGLAKSGAEVSARTIFAAAGLTYKQLGKVEFLPFGESIELMKNRQLDATLQTAVLGLSALRGLATSADIVFVPVPPDVVRKTNDPAYVTATIPAHTYRGQTTDIQTAAVQNFLVTHEAVSNDTAYAMTRALWTNLDHLAAAHRNAKAININHALNGMLVPLHPGAEKYYREVGVLK